VCLVLACTVFGERGEGDAAACWQKRQAVHAEGVNKGFKRRLFEVCGLGGRGLGAEVWCGWGQKSVNISACDG